MKKHYEVFLNLEQSPFVVETSSYKFYFSSAFNESRFLEGVDEFVETQRLRLQARWKVKAMYNDFFMFAYYAQIEKRGFRIIVSDTGEVFDSCEKVVFASRPVIMKPYGER
jgi:hypothetical protein